MSAQQEISHECLQSGAANAARYIFPDACLSLVGRLGEKLKVRSMFMGTAESCTGGLVAAMCTEIPGSSLWFSGGVAAYSNPVKHAVLAVPWPVLDAEGAVSEPVVKAMVAGAVNALDVQAAVALSGVAGPDGGSPGKPVGTVWMAAGVMVPGGQPTGHEPGLITLAERRIFPGGRADVRYAAALHALEMLERLLDEAFPQ